MKSIYYILLGVLLLTSSVFILNQSKKIEELRNSQQVVYDGEPIGAFSYLTTNDSNLLFAEVEIGGKKEYMLLDTGANVSVIDYNRSKEIGLVTMDSDTDFVGIGGSNFMKDVVNIRTIKIKGNQFNISLKASNLSNVINTIKNGSGVEIIGILGSDFFSEHKVVFDYNRKIFYSTK